jgi:hypothetical protein
MILKYLEPRVDNKTRSSKTTKKFLESIFSSLANMKMSDKLRTIENRLHNIDLPPSEMEALEEIKKGLPRKGSKPQPKCRTCDNSYPSAKGLKKSCTHLECLLCHQKRLEIAYRENRNVIHPSAHRCSECREFKWHETDSKFVPEPILEFLQGADKKSLDRNVYHLCTLNGCSIIFNAGPKSCAGDGEFPTGCELHRACPDIHRCPECNLPFQKVSGCDLIRCCPLGYHGCPADSGGVHSSECGGGCGYVFSIEQ